MGTRKICPKCGVSNPEDASYCRQCGMLLMQQGPTVQGPKPQENGQISGTSATAQDDSKPQSNDAPAGNQPPSYTYGQPQSNDAPAGNQPPSYTYGQPQSNGAPMGSQPPSYTYGQPQSNDTPAGSQPPSYTYGQPQSNDTPAGNQPPSYTYGQPHRHMPQYPFGQVGRPFGYFDGYFEPGSMTPLRSRIAAAVLCLLLGPFGIHKFYVGQWGWGIVSLFLLITLGWTGWIWGIVYAISIAEAILLFTMSNEDFQNKYHVRPL
jgi:TM2 domain-containing membrane protein YozV